MGQPGVISLTEDATQQTSYQQELIHYQVRSHPASVLPKAGGRYSHGVVVPFRESRHLALTRRSSSHVFASTCEQEKATLQSVENQLAGTKPEGLVHPL
jgi:hypothetical protein